LNYIIIIIIIGFIRISNLQLALVTTGKWSTVVRL